MAFIYVVLSYAGMIVFTYWTIIKPNSVLALIAEKQVWGTLIMRGLIDEVDISHILNGHGFLLLGNIH